MASLYNNPLDAAELERRVPLANKPDGTVTPSKSSEVIYQVAAAAAALVLLATMV